MENFRPPTMDEVEKKQSFRKVIIRSFIIILTVIFAIGGFFGYKFLVHYVSTARIGEKYQLLSTYYNALATQDTNTLALVSSFTNHSSYDFAQGNGDYSLYVYPSQVTNDRFLLFHLVDLSSGKSYLNEVEYSVTNKKTVINHIKTLYSGHQIP